MDHVYHWKHGWIPLDHIAALSKAKGNHKAAAQMLHDVANGKHGPMTPHEVARAALAVHDLPPEHRPAALNRLNDHADAHGIPVPAAARRNGSNRERLRNDVRTAQHAQQGRAEAQALGYKKETAAFYGSDKHAQAEHTERRLTTTQADHEARAQAASDREEARAHAERKKAGALADDLTALDGMHHPDDTGALDAKAAARVARMKLTPEEADRTLQAAFNLPESPDQQALIGALVNHIEASKAAASPTTESARLEARAQAKRDEAARIAGGAGWGDSAAGRLNAANLKAFSRQTDSALRRSSAATAEATRLEGKASLARSREKEAARVKLTHADVVGATHVVDRHGMAHEVVRVNAKSVTVKTPYSWTDTITHDKIAKVFRIPKATT